MTVAQESGLEFSETMSDDEFMDYLKEKGLKEGDCSKLMGMIVVVQLLFIIVYLIILKFNYDTDNGIGAKVFTEMTNEDIDDKELNFSFGGRKALKKVLADIKV